ncbi:MAG: HAD family hydrolase [Bdellovibrionota bacterium]
MSGIKLARAPKLILFDLDDTLIGSTEIYQKCYDDLKLDMKVLEAARDRIKKNLGPGHVSAHQRFLYFKLYLEMKSEFSPLALDEMIFKYENLLSNYFQNEWLSLKRDSLFSELKRICKLAIVTNENARTQMVKLKAIDPKFHYFEFMVTSEEVGVEKPDLKIFKDCFERAGIRAEDVLMIGDSPKNDLEPMEKMGAQVIGTSEFIKDSLAGSKYNWIKNLNELAQILN